MLTAARPDRLGLLAEAIDSVAHQTVRPVHHVVTLDYAREGPWVIKNRQAEQTDADWLAFLDDDDLLFPWHLERLIQASEEADVVYPFCRVMGRDWIVNREFDADYLRVENYIPVTAMVRRSLFLEVGGFPTDDPMDHDGDYRLWLRCLDVGARFVCVPEVTWLYRFTGDQMTP